MTVVISMSTLVLTVWSLVQAAAGATCWYGAYWDQVLQKTRYRSKYCPRCCGVYGSQFCCQASALISDSVIVGPVIGGVVLLGVVVALIVCVIYQKKTVRRRMVRSRAGRNPAPATITMVSLAAGTTQQVNMAPPPYPGPVPPPSYSGTPYPAVYPAFQNTDPAYPPPIVLSYQEPRAR